MSKVTHQARRSIVVLLCLLGLFALPAASVSAGPDCAAPPAPGVNYAGCNLSGAIFLLEDLTGANFRGTNLSGAVLDNADLTNANLHDANLAFANLAFADLTNANLRGANLTNAFLLGANLTGANLHGVIWGNTTCPDGSLGPCVP